MQIFAIHYWIMRNRFFFIILALAACLYGCKDDSISAGGSIIEQEDSIYVRVDTFGINSALVMCESITSMPDSFLLGEMENKYGTLHADVLAQFACPEGFRYPDNAQLSGVYLRLCYGTWFGDGNAPIGINAREMDKGTFTYSKTYLTNIDPEEYVSESSVNILDNTKLILASQRLDSVYESSKDKYYTLVRAKTSDAFATRFFNLRDFQSQEAFAKQFNGLYLTCEYGSTTLLNIIDIAIDVEYTFTYNKAGKDTTVKDIKSFYANSEVRQVNHILYADQQGTFKKLAADDALYNYIVAPANIYTRLSFPMKHMQNRINARLDGKRPYVNMAKVHVNVCNRVDEGRDREDWSQPAPKMLLIKESAMERFFGHRELPEDTCALLGELTKGSNKAGDTEYYYSYDMSALLTQQLRYTNNPDTMHMLLVPVDVISTTNANGNTYIISIKQQQTVSATQVMSSRNLEDAMDVEVVYSGF